jgi:site-specific DNA-cytosine methylase
VVWSRLSADVVKARFAHRHRPRECRIRSELCLLVERRPRTAMLASRLMSAMQRLLSSGRTLRPAGTACKAAFHVRKGIRFYVDFEFRSPRPIHPSSPRVITVREAARLHSYPDWFRFHATKWHGFRQIGNSVPPYLGRAVASQLIAALGVKPKKPEAMLALGDQALLSISMADAAHMFGVPDTRAEFRDDRKEFSVGRQTTPN